MRFFIVSLLSLLIVALPSPSSADGSAQVRFANGNATLQGQPIIGETQLPNPGYGQISQYVSAPAGMTRLQYGSITMQVNLHPGRAYTLYTESLGNRLLVHEDSFGAGKGGAGDVTLRLYNVGKISFFSFNSEDGKLSYGSTKLNGEVDPKIHQIVVKPTNKRVDLVAENKGKIGFPAIPFEAGQTYSVLIYGTAENPGLSVVRD